MNLFQDLLTLHTRAKAHLFIKGIKEKLLLPNSKGSIINLMVKNRTEKAQEDVMQLFIMPYNTI